MHWAVRKKRLEEVTLEVLALTRHRLDFRRPPGASARVTIERVSPRLLDRDNLYGGAKLLIDAMKRLDLIRDDSDRWVDLVVTQARGPARTMVRLETTR